MILLTLALEFTGDIRASLINLKVIILDATTARGVADKRKIAVDTNNQYFECSSP